MLRALVALNRIDPGICKSAGPTEHLHCLHYGSIATHHETIMLPLQKWRHQCVVKPMLLMGAGQHA